MGLKDSPTGENGITLGNSSQFAIEAVDHRFIVHEKYEKTPWLASWLIPRDLWDFIMNPMGIVSWEFGGRIISC